MKKIFNGNKSIFYVFIQKCSRNILKHLAAALIPVLFIIVVIGVKISSAILLANDELCAQTLSEALWEEFIENNVEGAKTIYKKIAASTDENSVMKASARLEALSAAKNGGKTKSDEINGDFVIIKADLRTLFTLCGSKITDPEQSAHLNELKNNIKAELSSLIKEDIEKHRLPIIYIISRTGVLNIEDTDFILCFDKDVTFNNNDSLAAGKIYGYNINWKTLFISSRPQEAEIISLYKNKNLWSGFDDNEKSDTLEKIWFYADRLTSYFPIIFYTNDLKSFISNNKIMPRYFKNTAGINDASIYLERDRLIMSTGAELKDINAFLSTLDSITGLKILPASIVRDANTGKRSIKLADFTRLHDIFMKTLPDINKNFNSARLIAEYKSCMANLRNITGVTELYSMEHENFNKETINEKFIEELVSQNYLKVMPACRAGGKYIYKNSEFICSRHGSNSQTIELKVTNVSGGAEKIISNPRIKTVIYQNAFITIGADNNNTIDNVNGKNHNDKAGGGSAEVSLNELKENEMKVTDNKTTDGVENELKFLKINIRMSKNEDCIFTDQFIADLEFHFVIKAGKTDERTVQFHSTLKLEKNKNASWYEIKGPFSDKLKNYKIYIKIH